LISAAARVPLVHVLQVSDSLAIPAGGTAAACAQLSNHLAALGLAVSVLTMDGGADENRWALDSRVTARRCRVRGPRRVGYSAELAGVLESLPPVEIVHVHGLWRLHYLQSGRFAASHRAPVIVSAHGMLHRRALEQRASLKRWARRLFQDALVRGAKCVHAAAPEEADEIRRLGFEVPIAVVPWGVDMPLEGFSHEPGPGLRPTLLYLGRLHPSKGLEMLLRAWARVAARFRSWRLVLAGYDEGGYRATLEGLASDLGLSETVAFAGGAEAVARERLFSSAGIVVLPSPSENFGFVVPEALARGVPVIATHGSPWSRLVEEQCGWWVAADEASLAAAFGSALGQTAETLREMGVRGRRFARANFTWERAAADMRVLYAWACGQGHVPAFVRH
jgi:glycosyltransferase involved in cell wall biosynthesis